MVYTNCAGGQTQKENKLGERSHLSFGLNMLSLGGGEKNSGKGGTTPKDSSGLSFTIRGERGVKGRGGRLHQNSRSALVEEGQKAKKKVNWKTVSTLVGKESQSPSQLCGGQSPRERGEVGKSESFVRAATVCRGRPMKA